MGEDRLRFDAARHEDRSVADERGEVAYRAWLDIDYVGCPVDPIQKLNVFAPQGFFEGEGEVGGYTAETAPILMPNTVGGYMPGPRDFPENTVWPTNAKTIVEALRRGYVVVSAGLRGRTSTAADGTFTGRAPAFIVDMKAAIRYVRANRGLIPGDVDRIVTNGTSAGGATSALAGASAGAPFFEPYLAELGAAEADDAVFAASVYCPIHNLEHADMAYEWQFLGVNTWSRRRFIHKGYGNTADVTGELTPEQRELSRELAAAFPAYVNGLGLVDEAGAALTLAADGSGSFRDAIARLIVASANRAIDDGTDVSACPALALIDGRVTAVDWDAYIRYIGRMKAAPAFDDLAMASPENELFGTATVPARHFTQFSFAHSHSSEPLMADAELVRAMNPLTHIRATGCATARHWRVRHGASDRDTSFAIPAILAFTLAQAGCSVDFALPWGTPHSGDYDLDELFAWIDGVCRG